MELKVWVEGVSRVVCGLSLETSCQDVVIALAQAIGQTGRYILTLKLRDTERQLTAEDCPLRYLTELGQLAADVQFVLQRTGPSLSDSPSGSNPHLALPIFKQPEPKHPKHREPHKALTFNLGHSAAPRRTRENRDSIASSRASPELRSSPVPFAKQDVFRQVLQQQEKLRELEARLQDLERETEDWEWERSHTTLTPSLDEELEMLEMRLRQNEAELMHELYWEEQFQAEMAREQDMNRHLEQISSSLENDSHHLQDLLTRSVNLGEDIRLENQQQRSRPATPHPDEVLKPLKEELYSRWQQGEELSISLAETERELQAADARLQEINDLMEEVSKEVRQCNLQEFIQQTGVPPAPSYADLPPPGASHYLSNAGILDEELTDPVTVC